MAHDVEGELYSSKLIRMLEIVWGDGYLSPGGPDEVDRVLAGLPMAGASVLDIGCGAGGLDIHLVQKHRAGFVTAIDVEDTVLAAARSKITAAGLGHQIGFAKVSPGPLPFPPACFDIVFSKDAIVHISDKDSLAREVHRVLRPGGWFAASDWLIGHDGEPSPAMAAYIAAEGLDFGMASPARYRAALEGAGFVDIAITNRNEWYRQQARREVAAMKGPLYAAAAAELGQDFVDHNIAIWERMLTVLDSGEHCPTHIRARRPAE
ncbi:MAG: tRNA (adenine(22)-N(1))-methyltransferase TrmK [Alphaproteobacteria bacterium]|nr:tRNA (adenine(22)-N(1))-methyltransferase TrmK [Alphaproteobacteria bacterium]